MAIPVILKGETPKPIPLAMKEGYDYSGCCLHVEFCGLQDTFINLEAGGRVDLRYTAEQTAVLPLGTSKVMLSLENANGEVRFMPWAKIKVTDSPADLYDAQITIDPATLDVDDLTRSDNPDVVKSRVNAILAFLRGLKVLALALIPLGILADVTPKYAISDYIPGDMPIMTNVEEFVEAKTASIPTPDFSMNNTALVATINAATGFVTWTNGMSISLGKTASVESRGVAIGNKAFAKTYGVAIGNTATNRNGRGQVAIGSGSAADGDYAVAVGTSAAATNANSVAIGVSAHSHGVGTFNIAPAGGPSGLWIGDTNLTDWIVTLSPPASWATLSGKPTNVSAFNNDAGYLQSYTESDPTISAWAKAASKPSYTASDVGAYSSADGTSLANIVNSWEGYWDGTNVIFEVTNYYGNTSGEIPRLRIKELREGVWQIVWDEANKFQVCETNIMSNVVAYVTGEVDGVKQYAAENFAPMAWGTVTDKGTTNVVGNSVWMTAPETYFAGGTEYQRVAVGSGMICVLTDNGALAKTTGEPGTFRFQDEGGTNYFGFAKSDSYTIGCNTDGITVEGTLVTLRYDVIMGGGDVPIVYWRQSLTSGEWVQLNNADGTATQGAPYTVTWYTSGGSYYAAINCGANASGFFKAETSVAGDVVFETNMKMRIDGGLSCPNTSTGVMGVIRPTFDGSTVIWNWSAK